jgi:hypothetical protein
MIANDAGGSEQCAGDSLERARDDQQLDRRRERAQQRGQPEASHAEREHAPLAVDVRERARHEDQRRERQQVRVGDPLLAGEPAAEVVRDLRQRDVDDGRVDGHHRGAEDRRHQSAALRVHRVSLRTRTMRHLLAYVFWHVRAAAVAVTGARRAPHDAARRHRGRDGPGRRSGAARVGSVGPTNGGH